MKIAAFVQERGACTSYRIGQPAKKIGTLDLADVYCIGPGDHKTQEAVQTSDAVWIGRQMGEKSLRTVRDFKDLGKKIVFDMDDSFLHLSPFSPHYRQFGLMPVVFDDLAGIKFNGWTDGVDGFDVKHNREMRRYFLKILREVDCVTVTTPPLQQLYSRFNDNVHIVPNAIDFDVWRWNGVRHASGKVRVVYPAGSNHQEDWLFIRSVLSKAQKSVPDWTLVLIGVDWPGQWGDLDRSRIETVPWTDIEAYPLAMALACGDIGIAPISEIEFNDCRSSIKWAEYAAYGTACIATDYGPYRRDCINGSDALLVRTQDQWHDALCELIQNETLRRRIAANAKTRVKTEFNLDFMADRWVEVFKSVVNQ